MAKLILVGMVEPNPGMEAAYDDWYLGNHVEDTANCPAILSGTVYRKVRDFAGTSPAGNITIYEFDCDSAEEAEQILATYQRDPNSYPDRRPGNGSLKIVGAGWYVFDRAFHLRG
jgi:hypothetical protein